MFWTQSILTLGYFAVHSSFTWKSKEAKFNIYYKTTVTMTEQMIQQQALIIACTNSFLVFRIHHNNIEGVGLRRWKSHNPLQQSMVDWLSRSLRFSSTSC